MTNEDGMKATMTEESVPDTIKSKLELAAEEQADEFGFTPEEISGGNTNYVHVDGTDINTTTTFTTNNSEEDIPVFLPPTQQQSRHDENIEPAVPEVEVSEERKNRGEYPYEPVNGSKPEATQEELDTMILNERANAMIEYIQNRMAGEKRADRFKQAQIAIVMIGKAKTEALSAMRAGRI